MKDFSQKYATTVDTSDINITVTVSVYMTSCFNPHINHFKANILHKINYKFMVNLYVDIKTSQPIF
jgi:hypothetical protein